MHEIIKTHFPPSLCLSTFCSCGIACRVWFWSFVGCLCPTSLASAWKDFVDTAVFCLHVLDLHDIFEAIDGTSEINLPDRWVTVLSVLARVHSPLAKQSCISLPVVATLLGMNPWDFEDGLVLV